MTVKHLLVLLGILGITECCIAGMEGWNLWLRAFVSGAAAVIIFHAIFLLLYGRSREFQYYIGLVKGRIRTGKEVENC